MRTKARLRLDDYFGYEGVNAFSCTIFLYCMFFWTKARFGFNDAQNLLLMASHGLVYVFGARYGGRLSDRLGYDRVLTIGAAGMALTLGSGWLFEHWSAPFGAVFLYTIFIAPTWPALEAAILHAPGKATMPNRLGFYNLAWALGDALGFFVAGFLFEWKRDAILWVPALFHFAQWLWMRWAPARAEGGGEPAMEIGHRGDDVPRAEKRRFMHMAWLANGLGYLMNAAFFALAPQLGERLGWPAHWTIWLTCTLLITRTFGFGLFWKWEGWHYRMAWLQAALWMGPVCLARLLRGKRVDDLRDAERVRPRSGPRLFRLDLLFARLRRAERRKSGGAHEAVLGVGVFAGPLLASGAAALGGAAAAQATVVLLALGTNALGLAAIARRARRG